MRTGDQEFEALLSACLVRIEEHGPAAIDVVCAEHPGSADRLRAGLARLQRLGLFSPGSGAPMPERIGRYEILARLGRGGMGVVYLARDPRDGKRVALKAGQTPLEPGDRSLARFEREIRAFAALSHEGIVRVLDVGEDEGRPYFTMEYVAGATLADVLEQLRASDRGVDARDPAEAARIVHENALRLDPDGEADLDTSFGRTWIEFVCRTVHDVACALEHVHAHGIVHRDVKPANILVRRDGRALVFDLGLAHVAAEPGLTQSGDFAGTPHYVSPEQARGRVRELDARSDVFSLGVTLYELLALRKPFDGAGAQAVLRAIQESEPTPLRRIDPSLPRDLETICLTALEKDPDRRYGDMGEFARDLRRFLDFQPVRARPASWLRRTTRFARRRPGAASALALSALVVVGVPAGLFWANRAISEQRDRAESAAAEARSQARTSARVVEFLVDLFRVPSERPGDASARTILDRGARRAESDFADQPLVRAALLEATGRVYQNLGANAKAMQLFDRALAIRERELGEAHGDTARALQAVGSVHLATGDAESARALFQRAIGALEAAGGARTADAAMLHSAMADALHALGDDEEAASEFRRASILLHEIEGVPSALLATVLERLGRIDVTLKRFPEAALSLEESLAISRRDWAPDLAARARVLVALADAHEGGGDRDAATRLRAESALLTRDPRDAAHDLIPDSRPSFNADDGSRLLAAFLPAWQPEYDLRFQTGITALQAGDHARAIEAFERCLAWKPRDPVCAYNIACAHVLARDLTRGLAWLERATDCAFGRSPERLEIALKDADLTTLRADPRSRPTFERLRADALRAEGPARTLVPKGAAPRNGWPVIVLLHGDGVTEDAMLNGAWRERAESSGAALVVPAARWPVGERPEDGSVWVDSLDDFVKRPWAYEEHVVDAIKAFGETHTIDRERIVIVGHGRGALVAFDLATRAPGLFRSVLLVDGPIQTELALESAPSAAQAGLRAHVILDARLERRAGVAPLFTQFLAHCGFDEADTVSAGTDLDALTSAALARALDMTRAGR